MKSTNLSSSESCSRVMNEPVDDSQYLSAAFAHVAILSLAAREDLEDRGETTSISSHIAAPVLFVRQAFS